MSTPFDKKDGSSGYFNCKVSCSSPLTTTTTTAKTTTSPKPALSLSSSSKECACGHSMSFERIVNGADVPNPGTYPWQAILIVDGRFTCGASLISPEFILTAAHCTYKFKAESIQVILGRHNFTMDNYEPFGQKRSVKELYVHPRFNNSNLDNDFSLLKLSSKVDITDHVSSICLPLDENEGDFGGRLAIATGWGSLVASSMYRPNILQHVKVPTWNKNQCGKFTPEQITENMLCAGGGDKDACQGDSGGPLVTEVNDKFKLIGVTSWGMGCGTIHYPGVYARVTSALPFIRDTVAGTTCF